jgi:hypothetical protein
MTGTRPITYSELYSEPTNNMFGNDEEVVEVCTRSVSEVLRSTGLPLEQDELLRNIKVYFYWKIGGVGVFLPDGSSPTQVF